MGSATETQGPIQSGSAPTCLRAQDLTMRHGASTTLCTLNLEVPAGQVLSILGPNGAGKTTTINLFMGFFRPASGRAEVCGIHVAENPIEARRLLAYIPESVSLYGNLTGLENLQYFAELGGIRGLTFEAGEELLARAGLQESAWHRDCSTYSKGMRQKVCVALALAKDARAMLLDEPTSGLDPFAAREFSGLVNELASQGVGALVATHDLLLAREISHRILILVGGEVKETLPTDGLELGELEKVYLEALAAAPDSERDQL